MLPWAAVIRLSFAIYMLGNDSLLEASGLSTDDAGAAGAGVDGAPRYVKFKLKRCAIALY